MSARRVTANRLTLFRRCGTCGRSIVTTADTPWLRMVAETDEEGKRHQYSRYYCSERCFAASYKHIGFFDGKAEQRRKEREAKRDRREYNKRYYWAHREEILERHKLHRLAHPGEAAAASAYHRQKRKLLEEVGQSA